MKSIKSVKSTKSLSQFKQEEESTGYKPERKFQTITYTTTYRMNKDPYEVLGISKDATIDEINSAFKKRLLEIQKANLDKPEKMVQECDQAYQAYRTVYMSKEGAREDQMLPMQLTAPGTETEELMKMFMPIMHVSDLNLNSAKDANVQVQMQQQTQYRNGQLVNKRESRTEQFINKDGKREVKVWNNGKLIKHTIDGKQTK